MKGQVLVLVFVRKTTEFLTAKTEKDNSLKDKHRMTGKENLNLLYGGHL